ncbi:alpha carbonic anhydrase 4 [Quercus suber]|uniref:Alpha carbonic anhydrase 4 n=1 Tax=Quercus suber TaxID=58331 RepID=A0AAW0JKZ7_QUESU
MTFFHTNPSVNFLFLISLILSSHLYNISADDSEVECKIIKYQIMTTLNHSIQIIFSCLAEDESKFTYHEDTGKGPSKWGNIDPLWKACGNGKLQSPIDLLNRRVQVYRSCGKLKGHYKPAQAVVKNRGHDISMAWKGDAGHININGTDYNLQQCHWHSPSEHTFNGSRFDLELHVVHQNPSTNKIAVVGAVYKYGRPDPMLTKVMTVSREQVAALREAVHDGFESNSRPTQKLGEREVRFYTEKRLVVSG